MIYVYCSRDSQGARALARELGGRRIRSTDRIREAVSGWVNWGERPEGRMEGFPILNREVGTNKVTQMVKMKEAGVPVPEFSLQSPLRGLPEDALWLPRAASHHEGSDLLTPPDRPAMWSRWENLSHEFRIHVFRSSDDEDGYVSVRLGAKFPRIPNPHPWIRSWKAGWHILYNQPAQDLAEGVRHLRRSAKNAVKALGLDFGAVDLGIKARDGSPIVLEVNSAPGLEGRTLDTYGRHITRLLGEATA